MAFLFALIGPKRYISSVLYVIYGICCRAYRVLRAYALAYLHKPNCTTVHAIGLSYCIHYCMYCTADVHCKCFFLQSATFAFFS